YGSGPLMGMAAVLRVPTLVIEPTAMPGFTNRRLAPFVRAAAVSFEESLRFFKGRGVVTGNPVRSKFAGLEKKARTAGLHLLVFGGSQGSHAINTAVVGALPLLAGAIGAGRLSIAHQTGPRELDR